MTDRWNLRANRPLGRFVAIVLGLLLAEIALRGVLLAGGVPWSAREGRARAERVARGLGAPPRRARALPAGVDPSFTFVHPFTGYETSDGLHELRWQVELLASGAVTAAEEAFFVLVLGGSVADLFGDPAVGGLARLEGRLEADPRLAGRDVVVLGHGRPAFKQPQQLNLLAYLLTLGFTPDAVIELDGFNEVALGNRNAGLGVHPVYPSFHHWGHLSLDEPEGEGAVRAAEVRAARTAGLALAARAQAAWWMRSAVLGTLALERLDGHARDWSAANRAYVDWLAEHASEHTTRGLPFPADEGEVLDLITNAWVEGSRSMHALCAARGIFYLHVLQPTLLDEGAKVLTAEEQVFAADHERVVAGVRLGYPRLRASAGRLAAAGVAFHDASGLFRDVSETVYYDVCHFERPWTEQLGDEIASAFLAHWP